MNVGCMLLLYTTLFVIRHTFRYTPHFYLIKSMVYNSFPKFGRPQKINGEYLYTKNYDNTYGGNQRNTVLG